MIISFVVDRSVSDMSISHDITEHFTHTRLENSVHSVGGSCDNRTDSHSVGTF